MVYTIESIKEKYSIDIFNLSHKIFNEYERFTTLDKIKEFIDNGFICKYYDKIIAYITFGIRKGQYDPNGDNHFIIMCLGVDPEFQGKGVGGKLIGEVKNYFNKSYPVLKSKHNIKNKIYLQVRVSNSNARKLYIKEKFKSFQVLYNYYIGPTEDAIHMTYEF
jgi:ribosomal protein S18 acetylase RimI-like enzyme